MEFKAPNDTQCNSAYIGAAVGVVSLPIALLTSRINPSPERFLGKPPEYVEAYTFTYTRKTRSNRLKSAMLGATLGTLAGCLLSWLAYQNITN